MEVIGKTFRVFVSSTFIDMEEEWNALQERVFPRLETLAVQQGCRFQVIDIRWGISEASVINQQSMLISLREIFRCQDISPHLNFIMLMGDRYGNQPLPLGIPAEDFETIIANIGGDEQKELMQKWYWPDYNEVLPSYELQPRQGNYVDPARWKPVEKEIRAILREAVQKASFPPEQILKYTASALEREIYYGALNPDYACGEIFGFLRTFENIHPDEIAGGEIPGDFFDQDENGQIDRIAFEKQQELKNRLKDHLGDNIFQYPAQWNDMGTESRRKRIDALCDDVYHALGGVMEQEVKKLTGRDQLFRDYQAHARFRWRSGNPSRFVGQEDALIAIVKYIEGGSTAPFAVYGAPGVGKSTLLAHALEQLEDRYDQLVYRFIGVTPESTDIHPLLHSLSQQISDSYCTGASMHEDYREMRDEFCFWLSMAAGKQPLVVFIDGVDQLSSYHDGPGFDWLPRELPPRVRFIVSIRDDSPYCRRLFKKIPSYNRFKLLPLPLEERGQLLDKWLDSWGRTLQPEQHKAALEQFNRNGLPLYLRLSFEEIRRWRSYDQKISLSPDIHGLFQTLFTRLPAHGHHGPVLAADVLGYLSASKNGLTEEELLNLLAANSAVMGELKQRCPGIPWSEQFPRVPLWRLLFDLQPYVRERKGDGTVLLSLVSRHFAEAAAVNLPGDKKGLRFHRELANYFKRQPLVLDTTPGEWPNYRKLSELPYQQSRGHLWTDLEETLCRFDFIEAKCRFCMTEDLMSDYADAQKIMEDVLRGMGSDLEQVQRLRGYLDDITAFSRFVGGQADYFHRFGQIPGFFVQQAYNMYLEGPLAKAASSYLEDLPADITVILHHDQDRRNCLPNPGMLLLLGGHSGYVNCVTFAPSGRLALSGSQDEPIVVWDVKTGRCIETLEGHIGRVKAVACSADEKIAISAGWDKTLRVWNVSSGECLKTITASNDYIDSAALSGDGKIAIIGSRDGTVGAWDLQSGESLHLFEGHPEPIHAVTLSADGTIAVSSGGGRELKVWNIRTGSLTKTISCRSAGSIHSIVLTPDGGLLVSGGDDRTVRAWDMGSGRCLTEMTGHTDAVVSVAVSADGRIAVSAAKDRTIRVWEIETGACLRVLEGHSDYPKSVALTADAGMALSGGDDQTLVVWDLRQKAPAKQEINKDFYLDGRSYSMDGQVVVSGRFSDTLQIRNRANTKGQHVINLDEEIKVLNVSPDGRIAVTAPWGNALYLWDTETGRCLGKLEGHSGNITAAAFSVDAGMVITADRHGVVRVWDMETRTCLNIFPCRALAVAVSPDGDFVLTGGSDKIIRVWHTMTGTCLRKWEGHTGDINAIVLSLYGDLAFSAAADKTLRVWDVKENRCVAVKGHHCEITDMTFIDGTLRVGDSFGGAIFMALSNYQVPFLSRDELGELLARCDNRFLRLGIPVLDGDKESRHREMQWKCSTCGHRVTMDMAKSRGLTAMGNWDCLGRVYCYFFAKPVTPQKRYNAKCPHWVSYEVLNFDTELEKGKVK